MTPVITITERETQLTQMLRTCSEALEATTKERDDALYAGRLIVQRCDGLVYERDAYAKAAGAQERRKPLSHDQIDSCFDGLSPSGCGKSRYDIARAIEAAHGIKEQP